MKTKNVKRKDILCKKFLTHADIVSEIMKACIPEYQNLSREQILECVDIDDNNSRLIKTLSNEDLSNSDNKIIYDVLFLARLPQTNEKIPLFINLEAQNESSVGYPLVSRAIYYASRLISRQKPDYNNLKRAYSIWICTSPNLKQRGTIINYSIKEECKKGEYKEVKEKYSLLNVVMLNLAKDYNYHNDNSILDMLSLIFTESKLNQNEISKLLDDKFDIMLTSEEVQEMSTLSQGIYEEGIRVGKIEGINIGKIEGIKEGIKEGMLSAILRLINNGMSFEEVVKILKLSKDEQNDFKSKINK